MDYKKMAEIKGFHPPKTKLGVTKINTIVNAAEKLFSESSFSAVSVRDICAEAHTAVGTFYIYFESKTDLYRYLLENYKSQIMHRLAKSIENCKNRYEAEREGIKCFIKYAVQNPNVYNIIWGSLSVEKEMFQNYYVSFAQTYAKALSHAKAEIKSEDVTSMAYMLMGITNFLGLRAIFENMDDTQIDKVIDNSIMPVLRQGLLK